MDVESVLAVDDRVVWREESDIEAHDNWASSRLLSEFDFSEDNDRISAIRAHNASANARNCIEWEFLSLFYNGNFYNSLFESYQSSKGLPIRRFINTPSFYLLVLSLKFSYFLTLAKHASIKVNAKIFNILA